jgi:hypothetical protein
MHKPAEIAVYEHFTGIRLFESTGTIAGDTAYPDGVIEMLSDLVQVQQRTNLLIAIPLRDLTAEEMEGIAVMRQILRKGQLTAPWESLPLTVPLPQAVAWLRSLPDEDLIITPSVRPRP